MPFPVVKLVSLGLRQASKYVANFVKRRTKESPFARTLIMAPARWYHSLQVRSKMSVLGMGKVKKVKPLSEEAALDLGTELVGDLVLIVCGLGIYVFIEARSSKSDKADEQEKLDEILALKETVSEQGLELVTQSAQIRDLERKVAYLS